MFAFLFVKHFSEHNHVQQSAEEECFLYARDCEFAENLREALWMWRTQMRRKMYKDLFICLFFYGFLTAIDFCCWIFWRFVKVGRVKTITMVIWRASLMCLCTSSPIYPNVNNALCIWLNDSGNTHIFKGSRVAGNIVFVSTLKRIIIWWYFVIFFKTLFKIHI